MIMGSAAKHFETKRKQALREKQWGRFTADAQLKNSRNAKYICEARTFQNLGHHAGDAAAQLGESQRRYHTAR